MSEQQLANPSGNDRAPGPTDRFIAYELWENPGFTIEPAPPKRAWMDDFPGRVPYRCLPIIMANQAGWFIRTPVAFSATWNGKMDQTAIKVAFLDKMPAEREAAFHRHIKSSFGGGILTFAFPWLFRTPAGLGLWVRGPSSEFVHNARAIEGLVETDWAHAPFTMNWKIERRNDPVYFKAGDPVCMLTPYPLALLESITPEIRRLKEEPELEQRFQKAVQDRNESIQKAFEGDKRFELNYMRGEQLDGSGTWTNHKTNFKLKSFEDQR